jgi:hydroxymethylglutaryl-CoA synthase
MNGNGITAYGAYVPYRRLQRARIGAALGTVPGQGTRAVAGYDEDATTLAVEAGRVALSGLPHGSRPSQVFLATTAPPYADKTNATAAHAALRLDTAGLAVDMGGAVRSGIGALLAGLDARRPTLALMSDIRTGLPGGPDELEGGDAAAAFVLSSAGPQLAVLAGEASVSEEFLDRWRMPGEQSSRTWEERFAEPVYRRCAEEALALALKNADCTRDEVDHLVATGMHARAVRSFVAGSGVRPEAVVDDLSARLGNSGAAHAGVLLADVLDRAGPDRLIAVVVLADGATAVLLRTTKELLLHRAVRSVAQQATVADESLEYAQFLTWRGFLHREPPRRPEPEPPYAPPARRRSVWKFGLAGSLCMHCGFTQLPPGRVCLSCHAVDALQPRSMADVAATVTTFTVDRLAATPSPPLVAAVIDFDGGGRLRCQLTDVDGEELAVGVRVEMSFRRMGSAGGIHNYFWKARPLRLPPLAGVVTQR